VIYSCKIAKYLRVKLFLNHNLQNLCDYNLGFAKFMIIATNERLNRLRLPRKIFVTINEILREGCKKYALKLSKLQNYCG